ncbi:hypothetical protein DEDE109153_13675 [Deinococcus deserti]|nr:hypothetical protein [Deinococcus deserti]
MENCYLTLGAADYLIKPFDIADLLACTKVQFHQQGTAEVKRG